jgi:hypothetical protein
MQATIAGDRATNDGSPADWIFGYGDCSLGNLGLSGANTYPPDRKPELVMVSIGGGRHWR